MTNKCPYCKKEFVHESSLEKHTCEKKRRMLSKDDPANRFGYQAYIKFYTMSYENETKTFEDFINSSYYKAFVNFGKYCYDTKVLNLLYYVEWLVTNKKRIDNWASDKLYTEYLIKYLYIENANDALIRAIEYGMKWQEKHNHPSNDCLRYGNTNTILHAIATGRISAWILYNCESGKKFLSNLTPDQIKMIWPYVDSDIWKRKFLVNKSNVEFVKDTLKKADW